MNLAPVTFEVSPYTGKRRQRCTVCEKIAFATEELADSAAKKISERGVAMKPYVGKRCGWWHLTTVYAIAKEMKR